MRPSPLSVVGLLALAGCDRLHPIDLPGAAWTFFATLDAAGAPRRLSAPRARDEEAELFRPEPEDLSVLVAGIPEGAWLSLDPRARPALEPRMRAERGAPPARPERSLNGRAVQVTGALPEPVVILDAESGAPATATQAAALARGVRLNLAIDPQGCGAPPVALEPWGAERLLLPSDAQDDGTAIRAVVRPDAEHALIATWTRLYLVPRGGHASPLSTLAEAGGAPRAALELEPALGVSRLFAAALSPGSGEAERELWVAGGAQDAATLWRFAVSAQGMRFVAAEDLSTLTATRLNDVAVGPTGSVTVVGADGSVLERAAGAERFTATQVSTHELRRVTATRIPGIPFAAAGDRGQLFLRGESGWSTLERYEVLGTVELHGIAADALEVWMVSKLGDIVRSAGDRIERVEPLYPPVLEACGAKLDADGVHLGESLSDVVLRGDSALMLIEACTAMLAVRRGDGCATLLGEPSAGDARVPLLRVFGREEARDLVGGQSGLLLQMSGD